VQTRRMWFDGETVDPECGFPSGYEPVTEAQRTWFLSLTPYERLKWLEESRLRFFEDPGRWQEELERRYRPRSKTEGRGEAG
jgi:hypothetical protein